MEESVTEIWKQVKGYEGKYEISNAGRVKSLSRVIQFGVSNRVPKRIPEVILKHELNCDGYPRVGLWLNGKKRQSNIHRLVMEAFTDLPLDKTQVNHVDGDKTNNHISNLEWVTGQENMNHAAAIGLVQTKLTSSDVDQIIQMQPNANRADIAKSFGVSESLVTKILSGVAWSHHTGIVRRQPRPYRRSVEKESTP